MSTSKPSKPGKLCKYEKNSEEYCRKKLPKSSKPSKLVNLVMQ